MAPSEEEERLAAARRALSGLKSSSPRPPAQPRKTVGDDDPSMLEQLVNAMKQGSTPISAVEPEGYGLLERVRTEGPITDAAKVATIEALQRALRRVRMKVEETGYFDEATVAAVQEFQKQQGLAPNGLFDAKTLDALDKVLGLEKKSEEPLQTPRSRSAERVLPESGNAFIDKIATGAVRGMHATGVPASISIAMAVIESNWGERLLARDYNNVFALRGKGTAGSVMMREDGSPGGSTEFRRYEDAADSVADHARLFAASEQYRSALSHRDRPDNFARALSGVYSPNPAYGSLLTRIMKQFDLYRFDRVGPLE